MPARWRARQPAPRRLPPGRRAPTHRVGRTIRTTTVTWNAQLARLERRTIRCPAAPGTDGELISELATPQRNSPGQAREWTRQRTPAAVTAATAETPLQITSVRSGASSGSRDFWWSGSDLGFLLRLVPGTAGVGECVPQRPSCGHAAVPRRERAVPRRGCGARHPGLLALRSANGLGPPAGTGGPAPTAFNRAGEKVRTTRGRLPRVICEAGPRRVCGLAVPSSGRRSRAPVTGAGGEVLVRRPLPGSWRCRRR